MNADLRHAAHYALGWLAIAMLAGERLEAMRKQWTVETVNHHRTGLLIAISEDLPGLYVHGRTEEEVEERIPVAIRALLEAEGQTVGEIGVS